MGSVSEALRGRRSTRAFLPNPVAAADLREILDAARWAPSGGNLQPWRVVAVAGPARDAVVELARGARAGYAPAPEDPRPVYPPSLWEPFRTRRFELGEAMYARLGIPREDRDRRLARWAENYTFFGAPVGLFFIIDERFGHAQWSHIGMFMLAIALAAHEHGYATCMQEAWSVLRPELAAHFRLPTHDMVYCGMALGIADPSAPVNDLRSSRMSVEQFARFDGFAE